VPLPHTLTLDLRAEPDGAVSTDGTTLSIADVAGLIRRPSALTTALRPGAGCRVVVDAGALSGVQSVVMLLAALVGPGPFEVVRPSGSTRSGRAGFLARSALTAATAVPAEMLASVRLYRRARAAAEEHVALPRVAGGSDSVLYLRADPSVRWRGHLVGGAATHTSGVINGFAANGVDVEVLARERPEWTDGVRFTAVLPGRPYHLVPWLGLAAYGDRIKAAAPRRKPDFVYQRYAVGTWVGLELAQRWGVPLVLEYNGSELWIQRHWGGEATGRFGAPLAELEERNVRSASLVVVVSEVLKEQLVEEGVDPERVLVNPNGVDVDRLAAYRARTPAAWRTELGLPQAPTVGFVGSFGLWHGVNELPKIAAGVAEVAPDARWLLIGGGQLQDQVRQDIARRSLDDRVTLTGVVSHDRALALLAACDVCVSPHVPNPDGTRFFGSPTKLFEYMGLGKAIVASDLEQLGEVITDGETGLLCPPGDAPAAAAAVARLLEDPGLRTRLGAAALRRAADTYSWRAHTRRILDALSADRMDRSTAAWK
jgi:glycosyltransferase involved in cell wall biosynthesis